METRLLNVMDRVLGSFWFVPLIFVSCASALGILVPFAESQQRYFTSLPEWLTTTPAGARTVLSAIAGAMITVAGVVFSVTMVTLSIASSQFGSRVLRDRMRDRATQLALGAFLGTSVYCLLVLRTVETTATGSFVPHMAVATAIVLSVGSLAVLIYFIHDVAEAIQAPHVVARLAADLDASIERLFPERLGQGEPHNDPQPDDMPHEKRFEPRSIASAHEGYLQAVDGDRLLEFAERHGIVLELNVRPGDFIVRGNPVGSAWGVEGDAHDAGQCVDDSLIVGNSRTPRQDLNCGIHELAQLSVRALSPGINDPFTAMNGIDRLSAALSRLADRKIPSRLRRNPAGEVRVIVDRPTFDEALAAAFNQIRQNAEGAPAVGMRLLEGLEVIARKVQRSSDGRAVLAQAELTLQGLKHAGHQEADLVGPREKLEEIAELLEQKPTCSTRHRVRPGSSGRKSSIHDDKIQTPAEGEVNG